MLIRGPKRGAPFVGRVGRVLVAALRRLSALRAHARADDEVGELREAATEAFEALVDEDP